MCNKYSVSYKFVKQTVQVYYIILYNTIMYTNLNQIRNNFKKKSALYYKL